MEDLIGDAPWKQGTHKTHKVSFKDRCILGVNCFIRADTYLGMHYSKMKPNNDFPFFCVFFIDQLKIYNTTGTDSTTSSKVKTQA